MAHVGSFLFLNYSDNEIHELNINSKHFCYSNKLLDKLSEYWILFEYFFETYPSMSNIGNGVYALCAESLTKLNPDKSIKRFFDWIFQNIINSASDLFQLVKTWANTNNEQKYYTVGKNETLSYLSCLISLCQINKKDNYIFECFEKIFLFVQNNILLFDGGRGLYLPNVDLSNKRTWFMFLYKIGSPLIRYKKNTPIIYGPSKNMESEFVFLLGLSKSLSIIQTSSEFECAFYKEYRICSAGLKENLCLTQPYKVKNPEQNGKECIFNNCMKLLGFDGRLQE
jgi:hypothetical protein